MKSSTLRNLGYGLMSVGMFGLTVLSVDWYGRVNYKAGYETGMIQVQSSRDKAMEARTLELAKVFAPYGYEKIKAAKRDCEVKSGMVCRIYGGYAPEVMMKRQPDTTKKGPY